MNVPYFTTVAAGLASVEAIKVLKTKNDKYIAFEGNGRLESFKEVFDKDSNVIIEVEKEILEVIEIITIPEQEKMV